MWGALWSVAGRNKTSLAFTPQKRIYFRELRVYFFSQLQHDDLGAASFWEPAHLRVHPFCG